MSREETSSQWKIACIGFIGALIGGICTFGSAYFILDHQQKALNQSQVEEQQNIARALYVEISRIETLLNSSISVSPKKEDLNNPNFTAGYDFHIYNNNGLYYVFTKEISRFDETTSTSVFDFYDRVTDIQNKIDFLNTYEERHFANRTQSDYSKYLAHAYAVFLITNEIPYCITKAENLKQELRQKYKIDATAASYRHNVTTLFINLS